MIAYRLVASLSVIAVLFSACAERGSNDIAPPMKPRPVTVLKLEKQDFALEKRLTGSVSLYREEKVGFEVSGRVLWVLDEGKEVEGPAFDEHGREVRPGQVIAKVDDTRYRLQVEATEGRRAGPAIGAGRASPGAQGPASTEGDLRQGHWVPTIRRRRAESL
jgi:hypothetical protein